MTWSLIMKMKKAHWAVLALATSIALLFVVPWLAKSKARAKAPEDRERSLDGFHPVRFALLNEPAALADTMRLLRDAGCERQALASFESLASDRTRGNVDLTGFPNATQGFYRFESIKALIDAVPASAFCGATNFDFNCFDAAFLLAGPRLQTTLKPDDQAGPFLVLMHPTNAGSPPWMLPAATPRDSFALQYEEYGQEYGKVSTPRFPQHMRDSRLCLTAALIGVNVLPKSALTNCSAGTVLPVLEAGWRRWGLRFPKEFEVLLLHLADGQLLYTRHAGLVFPRGNELTYIEKTRGEGYFVRLDVSERRDIFAWQWAQNAWTNTAQKVFVTLNENIFELYSSSRANADKRPVLSHPPSPP
jgi:hypothetical protein